VAKGNKYGITEIGFISLIRKPELMFVANQLAKTGHFAH